MTSSEQHLEHLLDKLREGRKVTLADAFNGAAGAARLAQGEGDARFLTLVALLRSNQGLRDVVELLAAGSDMAAVKAIVNGDHKTSGADEEEDALGDFETSDDDTTSDDSSSGSTSGNGGDDKEGDDSSRNSSTKGGRRWRDRDARRASAPQGPPTSGSGSTSEDESDTTTTSGRRSRRRA